MLKDPTAFRNRFQAWKETGESQYEAGLPKYNDGKDKAESKLFNVIDATTRYIIQHEGFVDGVYEDTMASQDYAKKHGYWSNKHKKYVLATAGHGFTDPKDLHPWTREGAYKRAREIVVNIDDHLRKIIPNYDELPENKQGALIDLGYQGGLRVLDKMPKLKAALLRNDPDAGKYLGYGAKQTPTRNRDRIALWNNPTEYRQKEMRQLGKQFAKEKATRVEPVDFTVYKKPILPVERNFDPGVPKTISIKNTFDSPIEKVIKAIDAKIAFNRILKNLSLEELNPWSTPQIEDIMAGQVFNKLTMPQITNL